MAVTQFIGPRQAPLWADPVEWNSTRTYEPYTFVTYQGDSYCTRQTVPVGIDITNGNYWVKVSDFNAQATAMQQSVLAQLEANETDVQNMITTAQNTIDTDIANANTSMNAQVAAVESVKEEFQGSLEQVETITPFDTTPTKGSTKGVTSGGVYAKTSNILVIFGDSWTANNVWPTYLKNNSDYDIRNYAISGNSYIASSSTTGTFLNQINNAVTDMGDDAQYVKNVILYGGLNDVLYSTGTPAQMGQALHQCNSAMRSGFPNARIIFAGINKCNLQSVANNMRQFQAYFSTQAISTEMSFIDASNWLVTAGGCWNDDNIHPNSYGHQIIASYMRNALEGGSTINMQNVTFENLCDGTLTYQAAFVGNIMVISMNVASIPITSTSQYYPIASIQTGQQASNYPMIVPANISASAPALRFTANLFQANVGAVYNYGNELRYLPSSDMANTNVTFYFNMYIPMN